MSNDPWQHRSSGMKCGTCMWFVVKPLPVKEGQQRDEKENPRVDGRGPLGRCRRHCPTMTGFPAVFVTDWCGDHKMDESRL
jgi:hypothetical protein